MNEITTIFTIGAIIFSVCTGLSLFVGCYFTYQGYRGVRKAKASEKEELTTTTTTPTSSKHIFRIHWLRLNWIYICLFATFFILTIYYTTSALGAGTGTIEGSNIILWSRWLVTGLIGMIYNVGLTLILTRHIGDCDGHEYHHHSFASYSQSSWSIFWGVIASLLMFFATISVERSVRIALVVFTPITFLFSFLGYFFPFRKLMFIRADAKDDVLFPEKALTEKEKDNRRWVIRIIRFVFAICVLFFLVFYIIWILSDSNGLTSVLNLKSEVIANLVIDCLWLIPPLIAVTIVSFVFKANTVRIKNKRTHETSFSSKNQ